MFTIRSLAVGCILAGSLSCGASARTANSNARAEIEAINESVSRWYATGNIDSIVHIFAPDARLLAPNRAPIVGHNSIRAYLRRMLTNTKWQVALETEAVESAGVLAVEHGQYRITISDSVGSVPLATDHGQRLVGWRRIDDRWRVIFDMSATDLPRRAPAASTQ